MATIDRDTAKALALLAPEALAPLLARDDVAVSPAVAAALTGRSIPAVRAAVDAGELKAAGRTHRHIALADLADWRGQPFTTEALAGAFRQASRREGRESGKHA